MKTPLIFTHRKEAEEITNNIKYNGYGPLIGSSALNRFIHPLEECAVSGGHNRELKKSNVSLKQICMCTLRN